MRHYLGVGKACRMHGVPLFLSRPSNSGSRCRRKIVNFSSRTGVASFRLTVDAGLCAGILITKGRITSFHCHRLVLSCIRRFHATCGAGSLVFLGRVFDSSTLVVANGIVHSMPSRVGRFMTSRGIICGGRSGGRCLSQLGAVFKTGGQVRIVFSRVGMIGRPTGRNFCKIALGRKCASSDCRSRNCLFLL